MVILGSTRYKLQVHYGAWYFRKKSHQLGFKLLTGECRSSCFNTCLTTDELFHTPETAQTVLLVTTTLKPKTHRKTVNI